MPSLKPKVVIAKREQHAEIMAIAKQSKYTKDFGNHIFSGESQYQKGWIRLAVLGTKIVGFTCFRHKSRTPETKLYFIGVDKELTKAGIGKLLMYDLEQVSPSGNIALDCCKENPACGFYERLGYKHEAEALDGTAWRYVKYRANRKAPAG